MASQEQSSSSALTPRAPRDGRPSPAWANLGGRSLPNWASCLKSWARFRVRAIPHPPKPQVGGSYFRPRIFGARFFKHEGEFESERGSGARKVRSRPARPPAVSHGHQACNQCLGTQPRIDTRLYLGPTRLGRSVPGICLRRLLFNAKQVKRFAR